MRLSAAKILTVLTLFVEAGYHGLSKTEKSKGYQKKGVGGYSTCWPRSLETRVKISSLTEEGMSK